MLSVREDSPQRIGTLRHSLGQAAETLTMLEVVDGQV